MDALAWPLVRSHSVSTLFVHLVWSTAGRVAILTPEIDQALAEVLTSKAAELGCVMRAAGNAADHVHVLAQYSPAVAVAELVRRLKGASSRHANAARWMATPLRWQTGYWAESVGAAQLSALSGYILGQRARHADANACNEPWQAADQLAQ